MSVLRSAPETETSLPPAVTAWLDLQRDQGSVIDAESPDPIAAALPAPAWYSPRITSDPEEEGPDEDYVMAVQTDPAERIWDSPTVGVPLLLYAGADDNGDRSRVRLATAEVRLEQGMSQVEPRVKVARRSYHYDRRAKARVQDYTEVLRLRLDEAEHLARVLLASVELARSENTSTTGASR